MFAAFRQPGATLLLDLARDLSPRVVVSGGLGLLLAVPWLSLLTAKGAMLSNRWFTVALLLVPIGTALGVSLLLWRPIDAGYVGPVRVASPGFVIEEVYKFEADPIRVAVDEGDKVFVSLQLLGQEYYSGRIIKLEDEISGRAPSVKVIADSPVLYRPFGLAVRNGEVFVSRSGVLATATDGVINYASSGFVTRLRDLDGDGFLEYMDDIVSGMPGARGPNTQHSNYGIAFGLDGSLFVSTGSSTNRDPFEHPWEGKILRVSPDFQTVEIFADGFRNPFGLTIGPNGDLFATDNDETIANPGDELNHIVRGQHYGHPYVIGNDDGGGDFTTPVALSPKESTYTGLTYSDSAQLAQEFRQCLYITDFLQGKIWRVNLSQSSGKYSSKASLFAEIPLPVDIAATQSGEFYVTTRHGYLYRIRPVSNRG